MRLLPTLHKRLLKQRRFRQALVGSVLLSMVLGWVIVPIEANQPNASIHNTSDGLWWAVQTLTTVGYGDVAPVTDLGRILGVMMVLLGTVMFGVIIAMISTTMSRSQEEYYWGRLFDRFERLEKDVEQLKKESGYLVQKHTVTEQSVSRPSTTDHSSES